jgi:hypothetical protein
MPSAPAMVAAMAELAPDYLAALAAQVGSVSAFLGGFAATFLAMFLTLGHRSRAASAAIAASAVASVAFVVAVIGSTCLIAVLQLIGMSSFLIGMAALLASLGASGWTRSRATGWTTTAIAAIGGLFSFALLVN